MKHLVPILAFIVVVATGSTVPITNVIENRDTDCEMLMVFDATRNNMVSAVITTVQLSEVDTTITARTDEPCSVSKDITAKYAKSSCFAALEATITFVDNRNQLYHPI